MDSESGSDDLVDRLLRRDESVLTDLLTRHGPMVAASVAGVWHGALASDVEEIVADVISDAWFQATAIDPTRGSLATWLGMRARYRALDAIRSRARDLGILSRFRAVVRPMWIEPAEVVDLNAYLGGLSELERRLVWLRFVEGRRVADVANLSGLTEKATERRLARLRDRLRKRCAQERIGAKEHG